MKTINYIILACLILIIYLLFKRKTIKYLDSDNCKDPNFDIEIINLDGKKISLFEQIKGLHIYELLSNNSKLVLDKYNINDFFKTVLLNKAPNEWNFGIDNEKEHKIMQKISSAMLIIYAGETSPALSTSSKICNSCIQPYLENYIDDLIVILNNKLDITDDMDFSNIKASDIYCDKNNTSNNYKNMILLFILLLLVVLITLLILISLKKTPTNKYPSNK